MGERAHQSTLFAFNPEAPVTPVRIGRDGNTVCLIDDALCDPKAVAALGFSQSYAHDRGNLYPGIRAALPEHFSPAFHAWLTPILQRCGMLERHQVIASDTSFFSVVTTASQDLRPIQCIPHYDSTEPTLFAAVIYLCEPRFSGTSFYRHRRTGYERITQENENNYQLALNKDLQVHGRPAQGYINGDSVLFERIFANELKFNGAIVYPAGVLHAASIEKGFDAPRDCRQWRLTVTALLQTSRPRHAAHE